jgi:CO dehydrogenase/acetyl-CoA synthase alpha subunit
VETPLLMHPSPFMDGTFIYYLKVSPEDALIKIKEYIEVYRKYGGEYIPIWHNRIYSEKEEEWKGWNRVFEEMVKAAV